jgi:hypothetical protein
LTAAPRTHICFGHSARGTLRHTLLTAGRDEPVLNFWGQYVAGPLKDRENLNRSAWLARHYFGVDDELRGEHAADERQFRGSVASYDGELIAWVSRRSAVEYCDFLEFLSAARDKERLSIIDLSEARSKRGILHLSVGACGPEDLKEHIGSERRLDSQEREQHLSLWELLSDENADLRMLADGELVSTTLDRFDGDILEKVPREWTSAARVVGNVMGWTDMDEEEVQGYGDLFWYNRLRALAGAHEIEWKGSPNGSMREICIRRLQ